MKRALALAPLIVLALIALLAAVLLLRGGERASFTTGEAGRPAPAYVLPALDAGPPVSGADYAGRAYVINVFASWCAPCRAEQPVLMALRDSGAVIVGVAYKDRPAAAARFLREVGDPFSAVALDADGRFGLELGIIGVPETFVVDSAGVIRAAHRGPLTPDIIEREILPALNGAGG